MEARVCQYENTCNGDFLIDRHPDFANVWLVGGGSGHGFKHGPAVGEYVAARIRDGGPVEPRYSLASKAETQHRTGSGLYWRIEGELMMRSLKTQVIFVWAAGIAAAQIGEAPMASKLEEFVCRHKSPTELTFGDKCSVRTPCNVRFNQRTYSFTTGGTVVLSQTSPRGKAYAYVTSDGTVTIGSNLSIASCTGCRAATGVTDFPPNTIPLWTWTAASAAGTWDRDGGVDLRGSQSTKVIVGGPGITVTELPDKTQLSVDTAALQMFVRSTPASSSAACSAGTIWSDATYIYVCVASGTIKRAALSTF